MVHLETTQTSGLLSDTAVPKGKSYGKHVKAKIGGNLRHKSKPTRISQIVWFLYITLQTS